MPSAALPARRSIVARVALVAALGAASLFFVKLSIPALVLSLIVFLTLGKGDDRRLRMVVAGGGLCATIGSVRFIVVEAVPGMVQGGKAALSQRAVSRLREVVFAEDSLRKKALVDPDRDGIGSAVWLDELTGRKPLRGLYTLDPPILDPRQAPPVETRIGPAASVGGYLMIVCLPAPGGGWTARPGTPVDEENAERRYVAYAWPDSATYRIHDAFFVDQDERILVSPNFDGREARFAGPNFPPPCDAALAEATRADWRPWRGKEPRGELPGGKGLGG